MLQTFKILLAGLNAKYIHTSLGLYSLRAYANRGLENETTKPEIDLAEYTINQTKQEILADLYRRKPDLLACSCYLWNRNMWLEIAEDFHKILPDTPIWFGGPEVSFDAALFLRENPFVTGVMVGEGEQTFLELVQHEGKQLESIAGIVYREQKPDAEGRRIIANPVRDLLPMDSLVFPYTDMKDLENRIVYYETSRGCPFGCSYCLSSVDKKVRLRSMELVRGELQFFLDHRVPQVKFVDRTFNCNRRHTMEIWKYICEHDNGVTNFHFELSAELLNDEEIEFVRSFRPGLVQFEIGVQSANQETLQAIHRPSDLSVLRDKVVRIHAGRNIHQHLDLIAGLPFEDYESFRSSFEVVYEMKPDQFQLGFLKVLRGSPLAKEKARYGIIHTETAPYEVLYTHWLPYGDVLKLKQVEDMVERYYNSMQFVSTLPYLTSFYKNPFDFYQELGAFYQEQGYSGLHQSRIQNYLILLEFAQKAMPDEVQIEQVKQLMTRDLYLRENLKTRPPFAKPSLTEEEKAWNRRFYSEENRESYFYEYEGYDMKQIARMTHVEHFDNTRAVFFDYRRRDPLSHQAYAVEIKK